MNSKQQRAKVAMDQLDKLRLSHNYIALRVHVHESTISRISHLDKDPLYPVGEFLADALEDLVLPLYREQYEVVQTPLCITLLATCPNAGVIVDEEVRSKICNAFKMTLANSFIPSSPSVLLPPGIEGALAVVGDPQDGLYLIKLQPQTGPNPDSPENRTKWVRLMIHEVNHLLRILRSYLPEAKAPDKPKSAF